MRLREAGGRAVENSITLPVQAKTDLIGIRPGFDDDQIGEGAAAQFEIIAVDANSRRIAKTGLEWSLVRLERRYQWYRTDDGWNYEPVISSKRIAGGKLDAMTDALARIEAKVEWGRYRLDVTGPNGEGPASSYSFTAGWYVEATSTETPDGLEMALDKELYQPGDTARVKISPRFAGKALVVAGSDRLLWKKNIDVPEGGTTVDVPIASNWGAGTYVTVFAYRGSDAANKRMPARAIGIKWLKIDPGARKLDVALHLPAQIKPNNRLDIDLDVAGVKAGDDVYVTIAAVDVGILNLTGYTPPSPVDWYFGQRRLGLDIDDMYGRLIDGFSGAVGRIRTGGDAPGLKAKGSAPTQKLVAFYSGVLKTDADGKVRTGFDIGQFNGTVRVMAVAWSGRGAGQASGDVIVRDPVVLTLSAPRFMAPGDEAMLRLDIANTDGPAGDYQLSMDSAGIVNASMPVAGMTVTLEKSGKMALSVPLHANRTGAGRLVIRLAKADGPVIEQVLEIPVRAPQLPVSERKIVTLAANGGTLVLDSDFLASFAPGSATLSVGVSRAAGLDVPSLLYALDRYPYGCAEQTTSRALPLLYLSEVATAAGLGNEEHIRKRVQGAIDRLSGFQAPEGSFGLWGPGSESLWLDAYVTGFLTRAREKGYKVPDEVMKLALDNLQNSLSYDDNLSSRGSAIAFALYVLARNRRAPIGDLRYFADAKLDDFISPMAKAHLAASLSLYGERARSEKAFQVAYTAAIGDKSGTVLDDYGSKLRDRAAVLALAAETRPSPGFIADMVRNVADLRLTRDYTSTQENAWLLLAARALYAGESDIRLDVNGQLHSGNYAGRFDAQTIGAGVKITNTSAETVDAAITVTGTPAKVRPAGGDGFEISRKYYNLAGEVIDPATVGQNERFVVVLEITEKNSWHSRIVVSDLLPAGFEIANPRLISSADLSNFDWLGAVSPAHVEFRDDRFVAALNRSGNDQRTFTLAYMVRAVTPGRFVHPAAVVEDMYRAHLSARTAQGHVTVIGPKP